MKISRIFGVFIENLLKKRTLKGGKGGLWSVLQKSVNHVGYDIFTKHIFIFCNHLESLLESWFLQNSFFAPKNDLSCPKSN